MSVCEATAVKVKNTTIFETKSTLDIFKNYYSTLADNLLKKLPTPHHKYTFNSVIQYYRHFIQTDAFHLTYTKEFAIENCCFLKDGSRLLSKPISELCNLSIKLGSFPGSCKIASLKPLFKKGSKTNPSNYRPYHYRLIHEQTSSFLSNNEILYNYQPGFRENHSTDSCLTFLHDKILKRFDKGLMTGMILIDLQKASGVPQGSVVGPLLILVYVNDMSQAVKSNLFLYAEYSCLVFQGKDVIEIEKQLNGDFTSICEWFVDNRLSIHFGEDKTKSIICASKSKIRKVPKLSISYKNIQIKQHSKVSYLGCMLDETMSGESMALKAINKKNSRLKFLHRKNKFLTPALRSFLCNVLIQPPFDYASTAWYPNLTQKMKNKTQVTQNKCIWYCLQLDKMTHISKTEFEALDWLPVKDRFN